MVLSFLFGSVGVGYLIYGRKQRKVIPLVAGLGLCAFPYFVPNPYAIVSVGLILTGAPWLLRKL